MKQNMGELIIIINFNYFYNNINYRIFIFTTENYYEYYDHALKTKLETLQHENTIITVQTL